MLIKIQKYFTDCGVLSRRAAEEAIKRGEVTVNGTRAELGMRIETDSDVVEYRGKRLRTPTNKKICIMLNKPRGFVTTMSDEKGRRSVDMLVGDIGERIYPVGRLDMDSDGLLLMTDDGELANMLTHPRHQIPKIYHVTISGKVSPDVLIALNRSMDIDGYRILPVKTELVEFDGRSTLLRMELYEGRNRQIRKMCETQNLKITRLTRCAIGDIELGELEVGHWRHLSKDEIEYLKGNAASTDRA